MTNGKAPTLPDPTKQLRMQQLIVDKEVHGGMLVEKYFLILEDGTEIQLPYPEWRLYTVGSMFPRQISESAKPESPA
jgi:hypothetical protein